MNIFTGLKLKQILEAEYGLPSDSFYFTINGKLVYSDTVIENETLRTLQIVPRVLGGKGGFGSMLRAIGAQIEKTTNREACRDLSGRRLRDINEEQRLKTWINQQAEREKEAKERKKKKLEKLCQPPKHEFADTEYDKERTELPEVVEDAVLQGLQASTSGSSTKRKGKQQEIVKKKKKKLWVDDDLDEDLSSDDDDDEDVNKDTKTLVNNTNSEISKIESEPESTLQNSEKQIIL